MSAPPTSAGEPITDKRQLVEYLAAGSKPPEAWRIGTEHEKFVFRRSDLRRVPYEGKDGMGALLETVHQTCAEVGTHLKQVREIADELGIGMLGLGFDPKWRRADVPWMP